MTRLQPAILVLFLIGSPAPAQWAPGVDEHTIALWLFDEPHYTSVTLTDASPHEYDLRLLPAGPREQGTYDPRLVTGGTLAPGKFGNALKLTAEPIPAVSYANPQGTYGVLQDPVGPNYAPEKFNVGYFDWTWEFWFQPAAPPVGPATVFELRSRAYGGGTVEERNALVLDAEAKHFILQSPRKKSPNQNLDVIVPTDQAAMSGKNPGWHHVAFTYTARERQLRHYVDGVLQPLPDKGGFLPVQGKIAVFSLGRDGEGKQPLTGLFDELRLSDIVRYPENFALPGSFSRNYGAKPPAPSAPNGPPLLFGANTPAEPVRLGARKHLFIDAALIAGSEHLEFKVNRPQLRQVTDFTCTKPWEVGPRFGPGMPDILNVYDDANEVRLIYTNGAMWGGKKPDAISMAVSTDGLHWTKPEFGAVLWEGAPNNNVVLTDSSQGTMFRDPNPNAPAGERYKYIAYVMQRGIYVYLSPDGIHWRRNETIALPFDCGGGVEAFWDDQRGLYAALIRHEGTGMRLAALAETREILKPWPFAPAPSPRVRGNLSLPTITQELPVVLGLDSQERQVYRTKAIKYPWAPDTYLAFPWRHKQAANLRPGSDLAVSRDSVHWHSYGDPLYFSSDWDIDGRKVIESLVDQGLIRRGDEIWQYATARFMAHGGAAYGGEEFEGGIYDRLVRLVQRLDGFVSLDAGSSPGTFTTRPLIFDGTRLSLNIAAKGVTRVGILDEAGNPLPGFAPADCEPITADSTQQVVTWRTPATLANLAGQVVRLRFEMQDAKLYALQFLR